MARERSTKEPVFDRRSYLKLAAATVGSASVMGTSGAATRVNIVEAGADDTGGQSINDVLQSVHGDGVEVYFPAGTYLLDPVSLSGSDWSLVGDGPGETIIKVPNWVHGSNHNYLRLSGSGWEVRGLTIDLSAQDAAPVNFLQGNDWAFRDVHMKGQMGDPATREGSNLFYPAVSSSGSVGLMENVIMKDGSADPDGSSNRGGMWFGPNNKGHMILRGLHMEKFANNTVYAAASEGPVTIEDCLFKNTNVGVRIGGNTTVRNSVWVQDGPVPAQRWTGGRAGRGLWINSNSYVPGDILIEGCDFTMTSGVATSAIYAKNGMDGIEVRNSRIEQRDRPGIHLRGGASSTTVEGVSVTGDSSAPAVRLVDCDGASFTDACIQQLGTGIELNNATGCRIENSTINVGGQALVLNSSTLETRDFSKSGSCPLPSTDGSTTDDSTDSRRVVSIDGTGQTSETTYRFTVSGSVEQSTDRGASIDDEDTIDGSTVEGNVVNWIDSYRFDGEITDFTIDGPAAVYLDGEQVDPATLGGSAEHTLRVEGGTRRQRTYYDFSVSGDLEKAELDGASINDGDTVSGSSAEGFVAGGADGYRFTGEITKFNLDGQGEVYVDGEVVDLSAYPTDELPNVVIIDGSNADGRSSYTFEVDGAVEKSRDFGSVSTEDEINGGVVTGVVVGGTDSYRFSGDVTRFRLEGSAEVSFEDSDG